ncbi:hypothetical protein BTW08_15245 [Salinicola sp. MH3R3-1]|uniref:hypothetical protein n=1 Tax=Salinicola sp. MH3R3-1 TaxID=1928762 RepID=UPI00094ECF93|nr:hypothetical protein [Salinicola sp. MH3R3-1]OLO06850.1 hypothetical protein BTW08_15245 [Salinicola sp. MH3R3-1]
MIRISDEQLDHYADRFQLLGIARAGIALDRYIANPERCELMARFVRLRLDRLRVSFAQFCSDPELYEERAAVECEPPLASQQAAILRCWQQQDTGVMPRQHADPTHGPWLAEDDLTDIAELLAGWRDECEALPHRNGTAIEPMRHHRKHRSHRNASANFKIRGA